MMRRLSPFTFAFGGLVAGVAFRLAVGEPAVVFAPIIALGAVLAVWRVRR